MAFIYISFGVFYVFIYLFYVFIKLIYVIYFVAVWSQFCSTSHRCPIRVTAAIVKQINILLHLIQMFDSTLLF